MSQNASLGPALPSNFANFGFSAPPFSASEGEEGRRLGGEAERRGENHVLATCFSACALSHLCCLVALVLAV